MENKLPRRKSLRVKRYDYSLTGAYFVTICVKERRNILSSIVMPVGVGATTTRKIDDREETETPQIRLTAIGKIVEKYLLSSENISGVAIDKYIIMPDHIHAIILLNADKYVKNKSGSSKAPTPTNEMLPHVISAFKRLCNSEIGYAVFQRGYYEHIIRDETDYETKVEYMFNNPISRYCNKNNID